MTNRIKHLAGHEYIACIGDSKTAGLSAWPYQLLSYLEGHTAQNWNVSMHHAVGGWTVANALADLPVALSAAMDVPRYVLIDLGVNEANDNPLPSEAVWESDYSNLLDQIHAKWPDALVYVAKVWRGDSGGAYIANCSTINGWIDTVIADGRAGWCSVAFDEANWLPSWSLDLVHPDSRIGGYAEMARQWYLAATSR